MLKGQTSIILFVLLNHRLTDKKYKDSALNIGHQQSRHNQTRALVFRGIYYINKYLEGLCITIGYAPTGLSRIGSGRCEGVLTLHFHLVLKRQTDKHTNLQGSCAMKNNFKDVLLLRCVKVKACFYFFNSNSKAIQQRIHLTVSEIIKFRLKICYIYC